MTKTPIHDYRMTIKEFCNKTGFSVNSNDVLHNNLAHNSIISRCNTMYLLTEWEGRTGKYLARGYAVRTERGGLSKDGTVG